MSASRIIVGGRSRSGLSQYKIQRSIILSTIDYMGGRRCLSTANPNPPTSHTPHTSQQPQILDESTLLSQLSPLKRIICLCPVPLGRTRLPWSGGDSSSHHPEDETINLNFQSHPHMAQNVTQMQPLRVSKYRYGERFAIGVAVTDPYLTHAQPVHLGNSGSDEDGELDRRFVAEIVPTFRCDGEFFLVRERKNDTLSLILVSTIQLTMIH